MVILTNFIKSSHQRHFDWKLGDKHAAILKSGEIAYGDNIIIYLFLPNIFWTSTSCVACPEDSPLPVTEQQQQQYLVLMKASSTSSLLVPTILSSTSSRRLSYPSSLFTSLACHCFYFRLGRCIVDSFPVLGVSFILIKWESFTLHEDSSSVLLI